LTHQKFAVNHTFMKPLAGWISLIIVCLTGTSVIGAESGVALDLGPLLGDVGPGSARLWAKATGAAKFSVRVSAQNDLAGAVMVQGPALSKENNFMAQVQVAQLQPATRYYYCVMLDGEPAMARPYPSFVTAPGGDAKGRVRFVFCSCVGNYGFDSAATWGDMATRTNFDLVLMLGDNHYANSTDPEVLGTYFGAQRRLAGYAEISRRVPQYAIWDNHDYGPEPTDGTAKNKPRALEIFKQYWLNPSYGEENKPGVYHQFSRAGVDFFMLDDRYQRSPDDSRDDGTKTMLGEAQLAWLKRGLLASRASVKVLACGCEWESHGLKNSWATFKRERDDLFRFIEEHGITGLLLISGDRHFTAAYQVLGKFIEVTSGPLGSKNSETRPTPEMFYYSGRGKYYCIYDIDTAGENPRVTLEVYRTGDGLVERRAFPWEEVIGTAKIKTLLSPSAKAVPAKATEAKANP
jgi:alkaline phosphatase D